MKKHVLSILLLSTLSLSTIHCGEDEIRVSISQSTQTDMSGACCVEAAQLKLAQRRLNLEQERLKLENERFDFEKLRFAAEQQRLDLHEKAAQLQEKYTNLENMFSILESYSSEPHETLNVEELFNTLRDKAFLSVIETDDDSLEENQ
ncbi:hypothetical protein A3F06_03795 [candidate division TM6 bacterium RIFCSPHIGHO2_12_FULL_36_22]|nr:MAG: hypothetical protein A3F06_03795 [candidate division TM6 bacterium RIFCSPHIGHO2_12_FULL_36_22]